MAIVLFTDFGAEGPYLGQMEAVIDRIAPECRVINLLSNAPAANPLLSAYLLAALSKHFPGASVFLAVVDPGVGGARAAVVLEADGRYFVGPDNGLMNTTALHARHVRWHEIVWRPDSCSASFHGRDIFAPVAARIAIGTAGDMLRSIDISLSGWEDDLAQIIYFDHYGNAMTGLRYCGAFEGKSLKINGTVVEPAVTFCDVLEGQPFWYKNSSGLIEIAVNRGSAKRQLNLVLGDKIEVSGN